MIVFQYAAPDFLRNRGGLGIEVEQGAVGRKKKVDGGTLGSAPHLERTNK